MSVGLPDPSPVRPDEGPDDLPAVIPPRSPLPPAVAGADLIDAILAALNARTARTYLADYRDFARFLGLPGPPAALEALLSSGPGAANRCVLADRGLSAGTVARRWCAVARLTTRAARAAPGSSR